MKPSEMPLLLKIEKARNEIRYAVNCAAVKYDLPGYIIDLIIEAVLAEEQQQRISLMTEQITIEDEPETDVQKASQETGISGT